MCTNNVFANFKGIKPGDCFAPPTIDVTGGQTTPLLTFLKYCQNIIWTQKLLIYFRLHCLLYISSRGLMPLKPIV